MRFLFLLFIVVPIIEITLLINVGQAIGAWNTVGLVLLSAFIGVNMLRYQGLSTLGRAQQRMQSGELPGREMVEGIVLAVGGALLLTPGFVTDVIGFLCLIPFTRQRFADLLLSRFSVVTMSQQQSQQRSQQQHSVFGEEHIIRDHQYRPPGASGEGDVIDGEFERKD